MLSAGIIGCGSIGVNSDGKHPECHAWAYKECKDTKLVGISDILFIKAYEAGRIWGFGTLKDFRQGEIEIISICTPPETHLELVHSLINEQPKAIYLEKPIATTLEDADKIIELCHKNNIILQVNHQRRFGTPTFYFSRGILNTGTHMFDMLRMLNLVDKTKIVEVDTDEPIFEFKIPTEGLILKGVEHLVECIKLNKSSISSGYEAREALKLCLQYQKLKNS